MLVISKVRVGPLKTGISSLPDWTVLFIVRTELNTDVVIREFHPHS